MEQPDATLLGADSILAEGPLSEAIFHNFMNSPTPHVLVCSPLQA